MRELIESLKRLYFQGRVSSRKLNDMLIDKKITRDEYKYIISK